MASDANNNWHALSADRVLQKLDSTTRGLSTEEAARRYKAFGPNELEEGEKLSKLGILIEQVKNPHCRARPGGGHILHG